MSRYMTQQYYEVPNLNWGTGKRKRTMKYTDLDDAKRRQVDLQEQGFDAKIELHQVFVID